MAYRAIEQPASGYSMVGVAAVVSRNGGSVDFARIAITGVGEVAYRATAVEKASAMGAKTRSASRTAVGFRDPPALMRRSATKM